jgi:hypothetical protein
MSAISKILAPMRIRGGLSAKQLRKHGVCLDGQQDALRKDTISWRVRDAAVVREVG